MSMNSSGRYHTDVTESILQRKLRLQRSRWALPWAFFNILLACLIYADVCQGSLTRFLGNEFQVLWYIEVCGGTIFAINSLINGIVFIWPHINYNPITVSSEQRKLFKITDSDVGFAVKKTEAKVLSTPSLPSSLSSFMKSSSPYTSMLQQSTFSPVSLDASNSSWKNSSIGSSPNLSLTSTSWTFQRGSSSPFSQENSYNCSACSFHSPSSSTMSGVRKRCPVGYRRSPGNPLSQNSITDEESLEQYLKSYEEVEHKSALMLSDSSTSSGPSLWTQLSSLDYSSLLRKFPYQTATRSTQVSTALKDDPDFPATYSGDGVWAKWKIKEDRLNKWVENLRKWISQTILARISEEIDIINDTLKRMGSKDLQIGKVSQSTLRQVALTRYEHLPTLSSLLPYLDITVNQEYLIQRIKELSKGGCMSAFHWNGGGEYKNKPWGDYLPDDCSVIMHVFCCYMNSRLPPDPLYPDGKTFTLQFLKKTPDKMNLDKESFCIYQSCIFPPHFRIVIGEDTWDLPKGRNNMFYAILLFLYYIKVEHYGMLGRVSLGPSGVNLLWVLD